MKKGRLEAITEIINSQNVETQQQLARILQEMGYDVTQATVSRDVKKLKLSKVPIGNGKSKYVIFAPDERHLSEKYVNVFKEGYVSMDMAQNILVIKTVSGMAMAVAAAIDSMHYPQIVGSIAGDDTIMMAIRSVDDTKELMEEIRKLL